MTVKVALAVWAVLWLVAMHGQTPAMVGAAGRSILTLTLGIAVAILVVWGTQRARALRASSSSARWLHSLLLCCATVLLVIHFVQAFRSIYPLPTASTGHMWIDVLLVAVPTMMLLVVGMAWPMLLPIFQSSATLVVSADHLAAAATVRSPTTTGSLHAVNQPISAGGTCNGASRGAAATRADARPIPKRARQAARAEPSPPYSTAAHWAAQAAVRGTFVMVGFAAAMLVLPSLDHEHASLAARHGSPGIDVCAQQKSLLPPATSSSKASPEHKGVAPIPSKDIQRSVRTLPAGSQRDGASRAPP